MFRAKHKLALLAASLVLCVPSAAISPIRLPGGIVGLVTDSTGVPQMGATIFLYDRQERLHHRTITDENGAFFFATLVPDVYSVRVTLASFVPAVRSNILVQPGVRSLLNVSLTGLFSSIQVVYPGSRNRALLAEDWKWVLRSASSTRPVLRLLPELAGRADRRPAAVFSDTHGLVRLSGGDGCRVSAFGGEADLGTAFALATSLFGVNQLQVSGNLGYGAQGGLPSAGFRTSFSRDIAGVSPEVSVTMRQLFVPMRAGMSLLGSPENAALPALRTMSASFEDSTRVSDSLTLLYGFSLDSVAFLDRLNYFSPYARLSQSLGEWGEVDFTYTSGSPRPDLGSGAAAGDDLQREINALSVFPRVSLRGGRARVQRGENLELGYSRSFGSSTIRVGAYRENITNASLSMVAPANLYSSGDILPDLFSNNSIFNVGDFQTSGYQASFTQGFGEQLQASVIFGSTGALIAEDRPLVSSSPDELRSMIRAGRRHSVTARVAGTLQVTGAHMIASYQWADHRSATRGHLYSTQTLRPELGLNLYIRQPIPAIALIPWRMEASADLRNLLAQGYLPLAFSDGRRLLLVHTPRSFRGGFSFIF